MSGYWDWARGLVMAAGHREKAAAVVCRFCGKDLK